MLQAAGALKSLPLLDDWLALRAADERRAVEFKREKDGITCVLWAHNYRGISLYSKGVGENTGDAFSEALRKIMEAMR